jgi:protein SCO1/2
MPLLIALAAAAAAAMVVLAGQRPPTPAVAGPAIGGPFKLINQDGVGVDQHILDGSWSAVFFGYTFCPDTCPATLQALGAAARRLGDKAKTFQVVFISVDPDRDTPTQLKGYLESQGFPTRLTGLTGTPTAVAAAAKAYGVYYAKAGTGQDYTVDHSAAVYLMTPKGAFARPLSHDMAPDLIAKQILAAESE